MAHLMRGFVVWTAVLLAACVTINVYFPAAAAAKAADQVIQDVWEQQNGAPPPEPSAALDVTPPVVIRVLASLVPAAHAQADIDISSPAIKKIQGSMKRRHAQLGPLYASGGVGLTSDGLVAIRDAKAISLAKRGAAKQLVADENRDRSALYAAIARANGHPEWEGEIRSTFASRWVARAPAGYWYQEGGSWKQK